MKFTQNTPVVSPTTIGNARMQVSRDPMTYGTGGKEYEAMAAAMGQVAKVAKQQQDDMDAADHMSRRNAIMSNITNRLYGEEGILTNGLGENAKGLTGRVQQVVKEEFDNGLKGANQRVRRSMAGTFNENMGNYLRIASQQEGREFKKVRDNDCVIGIENAQNKALMNYQDTTLLESSLNEALSIADYNAQNNGFSSLQREQSRRAVTTQIVSGVIGKYIEESDFTGANILLGKYGPMMDQKEVMRFQKTLRGEKQIADNQKDFDSLWKMCYRPDGTFDYEKWDSELERMANETKIVGGGGAREGHKNAWVIYDVFKEAGYDDNAIAGILGRGQQEHNFSTEMAEEKDVPGIGRVGGFGMFQWQMDPNYGGRGIKLHQWAQANGHDVNNEKVQAMYALKEAMEKGLTPQALNGKSPEEVADIWTRDWEGGKPGEERRYAREWRERIEKANKSGGSVDISDLPQNADMYDKGLAHTNNRLKKEYKDLFYWVKNETGKEMSINGGWRSKEYNASPEVNGSPNSHHLTGGAIDVDVSMLTPEEREKVIAEAKRRGFNAGGDDFYHNRGSGYHLHLTYEDDGSGSGGHAVNVRRSDFKDTMNKMLRARLQEVKVRENAKNETLLKGYEDALKNCSGEQAIAIVERAKQNESAGVAKQVAGLAAFYHKDVFTQQGTRRQSRGTSSKERINGENGYYGKDGSWMSMGKYNEMNEYLKRYHDRVERATQGLDTVTPEEHKKAAEYGRKLENIWNANYTDIGVDATAKAYAQAHGNFYKTISILQEKAGMTQDEAARYVSYYLKHAQSSEDKEEE